MYARWIGRATQYYEKLLFKILIFDPKKKTFSRMATQILITDEIWKTFCVFFKKLWKLDISVPKSSFCDQSTGPSDFHFQIHLRWYFRKIKSQCQRLGLGRINLINTMFRKTWDCSKLQKLRISADPNIFKWSLQQYYSSTLNNQALRVMKYNFKYIIRWGTAARFGFQETKRKFMIFQKLKIFPWKCATIVCFTSYGSFA